MFNAATKIAAFFWALRSDVMNSQMSLGMQQS
jgi:hypothetical protein